MSDTNGFSTQEEIDASMARLRTAKGRMVEPLPTYTFKNGAVATVHHIGQMTVAHIATGAQKKFAPIPVPTFDVDNLKNQPNPADPAYQAAVALRQGQINLAIMDALMELAIDIQVDVVALSNLNVTMELIGMPLDEISDKVAYIKHCCITDGSEMSALGNLLRGISDEAVESAAATFPSDLPGPTAEPLESAPLRRPVLA